MATEEGIRQFVCRVFVCPDELADRILARARLRSYARQAPILRQGEALTVTHLLVLGRARALLYTPDGQLILLHEYGGGDVFGAIGGERGATQDCDVVAIEEAQSLAIEAGHLVLLAEQHGCIGLALSRLLIARLRQTSERMFERAALSSVGRVHAELLRLARLRPDFTISPAPVLADVALTASTTRETASRAVSALERRGIVRREADALVVVAPRRLEEMLF